MVREQWWSYLAGEEHEEAARWRGLQIAAASSQHNTRLWRTWNAELQQVPTATHDNRCSGFEGMLGSYGGSTQATAEITMTWWNKHRPQTRVTAVQRSRLQGALAGVDDVGVEVPHGPRQVVDGVHPLAAPAAPPQPVRGALAEAALFVYRLRDLQLPHRRVPLLEQLVHLLWARMHDIEQEDWSRASLRKSKLPVALPRALEARHQSDHNRLSTNVTQECGVLQSCARLRLEPVSGLISFQIWVSAFYSSR